LLLSRKVAPFMLTVLVCPGFGVAMFSHDLIAKNNPRMARSAVMEAGAS
jgi:hypothetical protein